MRLMVVTAVYPTPEDRTKGRPIWATVEHFRGKVEFTVECSLADSPGWVRRLVKPRSYLRYFGEVDTSFNPAVPARPLPYFSIPRLTRLWNGDFLARAIERRARNDRPDLILAYRIYPDGYAAVKAGQRLGIPVVIGSRGSDLKLIPAQGRIRANTIHAVRNAGAVLCVSEDLGRIARNLGGRAVHVIRNGVDRSVFRPMEQGEARRRVGFAEPGRLIVFTGNLVPVKGVPVLLEAVAQLKREGEPCTIALIGEGVDRSALEALAGWLGIGKETRFLGAHPASTVALWLNAADVFCLSSESEGMPNVVIEALACGRNVVATAVGGVQELIDGHNGIVVSPRNPEALAEGLRQSWKREWDREAVARSFDWSWQQAAARTLEICQEVWSSRRVPSY
jgi:glycosyltransferase involved in cell wall biosynthesis